MQVLVGMSFRPISPAVFPLCRFLSGCHSGLFDLLCSHCAGSCHNVTQAYLTCCVPTVQVLVGMSFRPTSPAVIPLCRFLSGCHSGLFHLLCSHCAGSCRDVIQAYFTCCVPTVQVLVGMSFRPTSPAVIPLCRFLSGCHSGLLHLLCSNCAGSCRDVIQAYFTCCDPTVQVFVGMPLRPTSPAVIPLCRFLS